MISFHEVRYQMDLGCGQDVWRITGLVNGESRLIATPVHYEDRVITTKSGSRYKIESFAMNQSEFEKQIEKDIIAGGFEVH